MGKKGDELVGKSIKVQMGDDWLEGYIGQYHPDRGYHLQFFDGDSEWRKQLGKDVIIEDETGERPGDDSHSIDLNETIDDPEDELNVLSSRTREQEMKKADEKPSSRRGSSRNVLSRQPSKSDSFAEDELLVLDHPDEKPASRRNSNNQLFAEPPRGKQTAQSAPTNLEDDPIPLEDELLMEEDLDDDIMMRGVDDLDLNDPPEQTGHVIVQTYASDEGGSPEPIRNQRSIDKDKDHKTPTRSPRYDDLSDEEHPRTDVLLDMEDGAIDEQHDFIPRDLNYYQNKTHDLIVAQSVLLQPTSILLVGSVLSASFNTSSAAAAGAKDVKNETNSTEEFFFRVLFIEGGSQPIMFRCKTPIFTSHTAIAKSDSSSSSSNDFHPIWKENLFRCDMLMPTETTTPANAKVRSSSSVAGFSRSSLKRPSTGKKAKLLTTIAESKDEEDDDDAKGDNNNKDDGLQDHGAPFPVTGEIVISVYRVRMNGGNDLMGQMIVDLQKMSQHGTYEYYNEICEGRCYTGKYPLTLPTHPSTTTGKSKAITVGEIELQLALSWKVPPHNPNDIGRTLQPTKTKSGVSIAGSKKTATTAGGGGDPAAATTATTTATTKKKVTVIAEPRKIVSALQRKQREDQKRIDIENKKLQQALTKSSGKSNTAYSKPNNTSHTGPLINNFILSPTPSIISAVDAKQTDPQGKPLTQEQVQYNKYLDIFNQLKKSVSEEEDQIITLKAKYNNYNTQIKKYQHNIEKIKLIGQQGSGGSSVGSASSHISRPSTTIRRQSNPPESKATGDGENNDNYNYNNDNPADGGETDDPEYDSIKEEYDVMQKLRKSLVERIMKAKEIYQRYHYDQKLVQSEKQLIQNRMNAIHQYRQQEPQQTYGATTTVVFDENQSTFEKLSQKKSSKNKPQSQSQSSQVDAGEDDVEIFQTLLTLLQEKVYFQEQIEENVDYYALQSNYEESNQSYLLMQEKLNILNQEIADLQEQKEKISNRTAAATASSAAGAGGGGRKNKAGVGDRDGGEEGDDDNGNDDDDDEVNTKRELIFFLRKIQVQTDMDTKTAQFYQQMKENEIQLMYLQMKQKEREENRRTMMPLAAAAGGATSNQASRTQLQNLSAISSIPNLSASSLNRTNQSSTDPLNLSTSTSKAKLNESH